MRDARVSGQHQPHRIRSFAWFLIGAVYFLLAKQTAAMAAHGLSSGVWFDLIDRSILLFLLIVGYSALGYLGQKQEEPIKAMGLERRPGWRREFAVGSAIGWAGVAACALIIALFGGIVVFFYIGWFQFALIPIDLVILLIASLAQEVAFRGYPFQRLIEATNPVVATLLLSPLYALGFAGNPESSTASVLLAMFMGWLLSVAYLRTRGLWVGWGIHFAWNASMAVLFGLPLSGLTRYSPVISSTALGPTWLTGFDYGPEGSAVGMVVVLLLIAATIFATRDLKHKYAQPVIIAAGIPVDIDAIARRQHEAAMGPVQPATPQVVQISGVQPEKIQPQRASGNISQSDGGEAPTSEGESHPQATNEPPRPPQ
ncbi:MAG TPA: type II CAAX endopeptidase family protein [Acidobacteriaceae bacterium]|nr:type II CAAX endopeptidase family protein [Acidobacteriaceae bacterium]